MGGPMLLWSREPRPIPSGDLIEAATAALCEGWARVAGPELAAVTRPLRFTGRKKRRLVVEADYGSPSPWGSWDRLGPEPGRRSFTALRRAVNELIAPHEVDHIEFTPR